MLITGAQNVLPFLPLFCCARASRPIWLPVAAQSDLLNAQDVLIGIGKFVAGMCSCEFHAEPTPCVASLHHVKDSRPSSVTFTGPISVRLNLSVSVNRETISLALSSREAVTSQIGHAARVALAQKPALNGTRPRALAIEKNKVKAAARI